MTRLPFACILCTEMDDTINCPTCGRSTPHASFCQYCGKPLYSCKACQASILRESVFCPECGALVSEERRELLSRERVSWTWWLLPLVAPLLLSAPWVGGIVAWAYNRNRNPRKAMAILWLGISLTLILAIVTAVLRYA